MEFELTLPMQIFLAAIVSGLAEYLKRKKNMEGGELALFAVVASLIVGGGYAALKDTGYLATAWQVLTASSAFYALVIKFLRPADIRDDR